MKAKVTAFLDSLIMYDYILFGASFGLFLLFFILSIVLRRKVLLATFIGFLAFAIVILGPTLGYMKMHEFLFANSTKLLAQKKLEFSSAVVVRGTLRNDSKQNFSSCEITANVHKLSKNKLKNYIYQFKTFKKMSIVENSIDVNETINFKIIIEPFRYSKDYNITLGAKCK